MDTVFERLAREPGAQALEVLFEFGRAIVGNAGLLLTRVEYLKSNGERNFTVIDAAMNDLLRPSLYEAWHDIVPVRPRTDREPWRCDVVGPVCESGDWLGRDRLLAVDEGDLLAILSAGAYGMVMSSNIQHPAARRRGDGRCRPGARGAPARTDRVVVGRGADAAGHGLSAPARPVPAGAPARPMPDDAPARPMPDDAPAQPMPDGAPAQPATDRASSAR